MRKFMRVLRLRFGLVGSVFAVALVTVGIIAIVSASPSAKSATAADTTVSCASGTDVQTTSGPVCGITVAAVNEWLGIPYAAPPVGNLRWHPPQPPTPWTTTLPATAFGSACTQTSGAGSENCLFLNVWAPPQRTRGLPVMFHIHGGGFFNGSGNGNGSLLVKNGSVVVVSINYRLNISASWGPTVRSARGTPATRPAGPAGGAARSVSRRNQRPSAATRAA